MAGQHGFARNQVWDLEKTAPDTLKCTLNDNESTRKAWNHKFSLCYIVKVTKGQLKVTFSVENQSLEESSFKFTALLHTYFEIADISTVKVIGLQGLTYKDKLLGGNELFEGRAEVTVNSEVDRHYLDAPDKLRLESAAGTIEIEKTGFNNVVFWNPWIEKSKVMADFEDDEVRILCSFIT
jgi:glucose-6-phosphate 1-epimerase